MNDDVVRHDDNIVGVGNREPRALTIHRANDFVVSGPRLDSARLDSSPLGSARALVLLCVKRVASELEGGTDALHPELCGPAGRIKPPKVWAAAASNKRTSLTVLSRIVLSSLGIRQHGRRRRRLPASRSWLRVSNSPSLHSSPHTRSLPVLPLSFTSVTLPAVLSSSLSLPPPTSASLAPESLPCLSLHPWVSSLRSLTWPPYDASPFRLFLL